MMKVCTKCQEELSPESFYIVKSGPRKGTPISRCKKCSKEAHKEWREGRGKDAHRDNNRIQGWKAHGIVGMTIARYDEMFKDQGGVCAICGGTKMQAGKVNLCVDHNHITGEPRGLLCNKCNWLIGLMEGWEFFQEAQEYLGVHNGL